eukprot:2198807-Prymnesium_polylepis.1
MAYHFAEPDTPHSTVRTTSVSASITSTDDVLQGAQKSLPPTAVMPNHLSSPDMPHSIVRTAC